MTKSNLGGKGLVHLTAQHPSLGEARVELKVGTRQAWRNAAGWLAPHDLLHLLFVQPRTTCPWVGLSPVGWDLPLQSSLAYGKPNSSIFSIEVLSSQKALASINLIKKNNLHDTLPAFPTVAVLPLPILLCFFWIMKGFKVCMSSPNMHGRHKD